jgi:hypothetical protein
MGGSERAEDERQTAEEDAMEDLELNAETAGEVGGGTDPPRFLNGIHVHGRSYRHREISPPRMDARASRRRNPAPSPL